MGKANKVMNFTAVFCISLKTFKNNKYIKILVLGSQISLRTPTYIQNYIFHKSYY